MPSGASSHWNTQAGVPLVLYSSPRLVIFLFIFFWPIRRSAFFRPNQLNRIVSNLGKLRLVAYPDVEGLQMPERAITPSSSGGNESAFRGSSAHSDYPGLSTV